MGTLGDRSEAWDPWEQPLEGADLALVIAIEQRNLGAAHEALTQGANVHALDPWAWISALALAIQNHFDAIVPDLLAAGAGLDRWHCDRYGMHAVDHAIRRGEVGLFDQLIEGESQENLHQGLQLGMEEALRSGVPAMMERVLSLRLDLPWTIDGKATLLDWDNPAALAPFILQGNLDPTWNEREDGPYAPNAEVRRGHIPAMAAVIGQHLLRSVLQDSTPAVVAVSRASRPRL